MIACVLYFGSIACVPGFFLGCDESVKVAQEEFGPRALLKKYEWLKETHAQLDKKRNDIKVYEGRMKTMDETYKSIPRIQWPREDREQHNTWSSEVAGTKASYNDLAAQYNAKMKEEHWRFANKGELPQGASEVLPRDYVRYEDK